MGWRFFTSTGAEKMAPASTVVPSVRVTNSASVAISASAAAITFDTETWKTDAGMHSGGAPTRLVCTTAGKYHVTAQGQGALAWAATDVFSIRKNGSTYLPLGSIPTYVVNTNEGILSMVVDLAVGDYLELFSSRAAGATTFGAGNVEFAMTKVDGAVVSYVGVPGSLVGQELAYNEFTADVSQTATTAATANTVVTASSISLDGSTPVVVEFFAPYGISAAGQLLNIELYDNGSATGLMGTFGAAATIDGTPNYRRRITPSAGAHVYSARAWAGAAGGTVKAGVGGAGVLMPGFIRIVRAA
ncbi:MAG TPA: hypothetical protein VIY48_02100 [Candidatus Paceibacterota bacterium]